MAAFEKFKKVVFSVAYACEYIGWFILLGWVGLMFMGTIARYIFRSPFLFQVDVVSGSLVIFCTVCFSAVFLADGHIRVDFFTRLLPRRIQDIFWLFSEFIFFVFSIAVAYSSLGPLSHALAVGSCMDLVAIPTAPFIMFIPFGFCLLALVLLIDFCERIYKISKTSKVNG